MECKQEYHLDPQTIKKQILREQKIRKYYKQLHANKLDNLSKMGKFQKNTNCQTHSRRNRQSVPKK